MPCLHLAFSLCLDIENTHKPNSFYAHLSPNKCELMNKNKHSVLPLSLILLRMIFSLSISFSFVSSTVFVSMTYTRQKA